MNSKINDLINKLNPTTVFIPFPDRHIDHRTVFDCAMVNSRPNKKSTLNMFYHMKLSLKLTGTLPILRQILTQIFL